jgi:hypothetical protein
MNKHDENQIKQLLRQSLPPVESNAEPERDLWPAVLRKLDEGAGAGAVRRQPISFSVPWFDWALLGGLAVFAVSFPATIPVFLYYL